MKDRQACIQKNLIVQIAGIPIRVPNVSKKNCSKNTDSHTVPPDRGRPYNGIK
jgi:hypothetical protein